MTPLLRCTTWLSIAVTFALLVCPTAALAQLAQGDKDKQPPGKGDQVQAKGVTGDQGGMMGGMK